MSSEPQNQPSSKPPSVGITSPWIFSPRVDGVCLIGMIPVGVLYGLFANGRPWFGDPGNFAIYALLGLPHFGSTWSFYLDRVNLAHFRRNPWIYFVAPAALVLSSIALAALSLGQVIVLITYVFSGWHVMKQNTGFANLYRSRIGLLERWDRRVDNLAILSASIFCLAARLVRYDDGWLSAGMSQTYAFQGLVGVLGLIAGGALLVWGVVTFQRWRRLGREVLPLFFFTLAAIAMFLPFITVERFPDAFFASLAGHYVQYMCLVWVIGARKYNDSTIEKYGSLFLARMSQSVFKLGGVLLLYSYFVGVGSMLSPLFPAIGLTWAHFFVDRYLFRFRDQHVRVALSPFLRPGPAHTSSLP